MNRSICISVILPTYNRIDRLKRVLSGLEVQDFPKDQFEVIVISDGSTDGTERYLQSVQASFRLVPILQANQGPAAARNAGLACAQGDLIVFLDDDVYPTPQLLSEHFRAHLQETQPTAVIGPMLTPSDYHPTFWVRWSHDRLLEQYDAMQKGLWKPAARQFYTGNASFRRELFLKYGGFDATFDRAEDVELAYRYETQGVQFHFSPEAVGYHYEERSLASWSKIGYAYGKYDVVFSQQKGHDWLLPIICIEFQKRHPILRQLVLLSLDRRSFTRWITAVNTFLGQLGDRWNWKLLQRIGCSAIFNINYYQGVSDELGGKDALRAGLRSGPCGLTGAAERR